MKSTRTTQIVASQPNHQLTRAFERAHVTASVISTPDGAQTVYTVEGAQYPSLEAAATAVAAGGDGGDTR